MRKIREVLRLAHSARSQREIALAIRASLGTVWNQLQRASAAKITWEDAQQLTDHKLNELLFAKGSTQPSQRSPVNFARVHEELHRVRSNTAVAVNGVSRERSGTR